MKLEKLIKGIGGKKEIKINISGKNKLLSRRAVQEIIKSIMWPYPEVTRINKEIFINLVIKRVKQRHDRYKKHKKIMSEIELLYMIEYLVAQQEIKILNSIIVQFSSDPRAG